MNQNYFTIRSPNRITAFNSLCPPESKVMLREIIRRKREKSSSQIEFESYVDGEPRRKSIGYDKATKSQQRLEAKLMFESTKSIIQKEEIPSLQVIEIKLTKKQSQRPQRVLRKQATIQQYIQQRSNKNSERPQNNNCLNFLETYLKSHRSSKAVETYVCDKYRKIKMVQSNSLQEYVGNSPVKLRKSKDYSKIREQALRRCYTSRVY